jgi:ELWxxDGT repeat protein
MIDLAQIARHIRTLPRAFLLLTFFIGYTPATSSDPCLFKDIYPGLAGSDPLYLTVVGGTLFFSAVDPTHGRELWKSDGTPTGTALVKDINPELEGWGPDFLIGVNGTLFFSADDFYHGRELWKSDGTLSGTVLVKDIDPGAVD